MREKQRGELKIQRTASSCTEEHPAASGGEVATSTTPFFFLHLTPDQMPIDSLFFSLSLSPSLSDEKRSWWRLLDNHPDLSLRIFSLRQASAPQLLIWESWSLPLLFLSNLWPSFFLFISASRLDSITKIRWKSFLGPGLSLMVIARQSRRKEKKKKSVVVIFSGELTSIGILIFSADFGALGSVQTDASLGGLWRRRELSLGDRPSSERNARGGAVHKHTVECKWIEACALGYGARVRSVSCPFFSCFLTTLRKGGRRRLQREKRRRRRCNDSLCRFL